MRVQIAKLDHFGKGICFLDGKICFIEGALPGEEVEIEIKKEYKKYLEANLIEIYHKSPYRMNEACSYASVCGGCCFQDYDYIEENHYKEEKVKEIIERFSGYPSSIVLPIRFGEKDFYRNKLVLHGMNGKLGLYQEKTHDVVPIDSCYLVHSRINGILPLLNNLNKDLKDATIKCSNGGEELLLSIHGDVTSLEPLKQACSVLIHNGQYLTVKHDIVNTIGNRRYHESCDSFFQVHSSLTKDLYDTVYQAVSHYKPRTVLDLYCGTGTIGIYIASLCMKVIGIDCSESNIFDAKNNLTLNNVTNAEFLCDKVENVIDRYQGIDCVIVDPPRSGLDPKTKAALLKMRPSTIIYVSCDPMTLARDLKELGPAFNAVSVQPFNMFPRTYHCENICILERR